MRWAALLLALFFAAPTLAHDWTGMSNPQLQDWFMQLRRQDNMSCCGLGDAYRVQILKEADMNHPYDETGEFEVIDGSEMDVTLTGPDAGENTREHRAYLPNGTRHSFSYFQVTKEKAGNPTPFAWVFMSVWQVADHPENNGISTVYCVVPLPPSF